MLWMVLEGCLEVHGETFEMIPAFDDCMTERQMFIGGSHQAIRIPFDKVLKPHL